MKILKQPDYTLVQIVRAKHLNNNKDKFLTYKKRYNESPAWKNILIKKGIKWSLGNSEDIYFWKDIWFTDSPIIDFVYPDKRNDVNINYRVSNFIDVNKNWKIDDLATYLSQNIMMKIKDTPIPVSSTDDKISTGHFPIKSAT